MNSINLKKRILIVTNQANNEPAKHIKQWLVSLGAEIVAVNTEDDFFQITYFDLDSGQFNFRIGSNEYKSTQFYKFYFHRGAFKLPNRLLVRANRGDIRDIDNAFAYYFTNYEKTIKELSKICFDFDNTIGQDNGGRINKIETLNVAQDCGLKIPKSILTTSKTDLKQFIIKVGSVICKSMDLNLTFIDQKKNKFLHNLTSEIVDTEIFPEEFPLSIFQENVEKFVELRIFYFDDSMHAAAIFSQASHNTVQDYRNYDFSNPNRVIPYEIPESLKKKLKSFQIKMELRTGSIDIILTEKGEFYFLELNPQGQFMGISSYCNYNLDKVIAKQLLK